MTPQKIEKTDLEHFFSLLTSLKSGINIRQASNHNNTIDISASSSSDETDQPDSLRVPEVIIVICVLLLWCGSIFIFIRHSELLRIRHRDLPFRSARKLPMNLNQITIVNQTSDTIIYPKSRISSTTVLAPPISNSPINKYRRGETIETISSAISPTSRKPQHTHSFDLNPSLSTKYSFDKHDDKEQLLSPHRISTEIKRSLLDLHRISMDNLHRKSMENLSSIKCSTFYSANDMTSPKHRDGQHLIVKKRCVQESPV